MPDSSYFKDRVAVDGRIDPWGTIQIALGSPQHVSADNRANRIPMWSEELIPYCNLGLKAVVTKDSVHVVAEDGTVMKEIPHNTFIAVKILLDYVHDDGYLQDALSHKEGVRAQAEMCREALRQAARGEMPCYLDNTAYVHIDSEFAGQEVVTLKWGPRHSSCMVFTKDGVRISSQLDYPLSFAKWDPRHPLAKHGMPEKKDG